MSDVNSLLQMQYPSGTPAQSALSMDYPGEEKTAINPAAAPSTGERIIQGLGDTEVGLGQLVEHTPILNTITSGWRQLIQQGLKTAGFGHASELFDQSGGDLTDQKAADNFDSIVRTREKEYQDARSAAGQTGIDWWRLGGQAANPINYLAPEGAATTTLGRIAQGAGQGALIGAEQPVQTNGDGVSNLVTGQAPGSYWWDKVKNIAGGAFGGGAASGVVELVSPVLRAGIDVAKRVLGNNAANTTAAESVVNDALRAKGIDPNTIDLPILSGMKQEVQEALKEGGEISPSAIVNRTKAEALPVPMNLTRGMATRDPGLMTDEYNLMQIKGLGDPLRNHIQALNEATKENLDALGASSNQDIVSTGQNIQKTVQSAWDHMQEQKTQLYDAVKNSQGLAASVDGQSAAREIRETLGAPESMGAWYYLPKEMKSVIGDMEEGKLPLTVSNLQTLDKAWGQDAAAADGSTRNAIGQARTILGKANIQDDVGQDAMKAYQMAKQAHSIQMGMVTPKLLNDMPNPKYEPLMDDIVYGGASPEKIFNKHFLNESGSQAGKNMQFLSEINPDMPKLIGNTIFTEIKRQATGSANVENAPVSESVLRQWANSPQKSSVLENLLPAPQLQTFKNLSDTVSNTKLFPAAATPNRSGTSGALINAATSALKSGATASLVKKVPIAGDLMDVMGAVKAEGKVQSALNPGVTLKSILRKNDSGKRLMSRLATPAVIGAFSTDKDQPTPPEE